MTNAMQNPCRQPRGARSLLRAQSRHARAQSQEGLRTARHRRQSRVGGTRPAL